MTSGVDQGTLVEQNSHLCSGQSASCRVIENGTHLFCDAGKPFDKLRCGRSVLEILKERGDRNPCSARNAHAPCFVQPQDKTTNQSWPHTTAAVDDTDDQDSRGSCKL
jgi:hypothetical protein